jgi:AraC-like DNA-binding protein
MSALCVAANDGAHITLRRMISPSLLTRLSRARELLQESRERVHVEQAAREAALSPYHFIRLFKATFGCTPHQALVEARLDRAKRLLLAADLSVTEVCMEVGFASLGSFSSLFARRVGVSPALYRRRYHALATVPGAHPTSLIPGCYALMWGWPASAASSTPQFPRSSVAGEPSQSGP